MRKLTVLLVAIGVFFAVTIANASLPFGGDNFRVGVVNLQQVLAKSPTFVKEQKALQNDITADQDKLKAQEAKVNADIQKLQKANDNTTKQKLATKINNDRKALMDDINKFRQDSIKKRQTMLQPVLAKIRKVMRQVATAKNLQLIVPNNAVLYFDPKLDVTDAVSKAFNAAN